MDPLNEKVRVRFITKHEEFKVLDAPLAIPSTLNRSGLIEVINHLLSRDEIQAFDFLVDNRILRQPLYKLLQKLQLSTENVITIEYFPSVSLSEKSEGLEVPAWIGCLDNSFSHVTIAGTYDGQLQIINNQSYNTEMSIQAHEEPIRALVCIPYSASSTLFSTESVSADMGLIATSGKDKSVKIWGYQPSSHRIANKPIITFDGHINSVECLAYYSIDNLLLSGDWSGNIFAWDLKAESIKSRLHDQSGSIFDSSSNNSVSSDQQHRKKKKVTANNTITATTTDSMDVVNNDDSAITNYSKPLFTIHAHAQKVSSINAIPEDKQIMVASWDHMIKLYDMETQNSIHHFSTLKVITSIDHKSSFHLTLSSHTDGKIRLWDSRQKETISSLETYGKDKELSSWVSQVKWQPVESSYLFASADYDGCIKLWDMRSSMPLGSNNCHDGKALCVNWASTESGWNIVSGGSDCFLKSTPVQV